MKIIAIGDTHGRNSVIDIITKNIDLVDKIVLIGDYFDSFDIGGEQQIDNFKTIIDFKNAFPDKIILLIGNHDCHYLNFWNERYSGFQPGWQFSISHLIHTNLDLLQMVYYIDGIYFTHAGINRQWCSNNDIDIDNIEQSVNDAWKYTPFKSFRFNGRDHYGDDITQSPIWVRPNSLIDDAIPGIHVVGHTQQPNGISKNNTKDGKIYFIDCLNYKKQYLLIDTNEMSFEGIDVKTSI